MGWSRLGVATLCASCFPLLLAGSALASVPAESAPSGPSAADVDQPATDATSNTLDEVIVTGTSRERRKFDAAYAVSTLSAQQIEIYAPLSTVDLMAKLPGFGAEPSGGETGNNVNVRGLPVSNFKFVAVVEDGLPIFQEQQEAFLNADELSRIDLMTERVETVRGGTSPIFESNAPGATVNLISRVGSNDPQGTVRYTTGDFGLNRLDAAWSGPIGPGLLLAVGGYYRADNGPRPTGFTADQGGQLRINLTKRFDGGQLTVYLKRLDDRTVFYLPIPLDDPRNPSASLAGLLDPHTGTLTSSAIQNVTVRTLNGTPGGTTVNQDLGDGVHPRVNTFGANFDWQAPGGWHLSNKTRYSAGPVRFNALFSLTPPQDAAGFLASELPLAQAGLSPQVSSLEYVLANPRTVGGGRIPFNTASTNGLIVQGGWWGVNNDITDFINDLRVSRTLTDPLSATHDLSAGIYFSNYTLFQTRLFDTMLLEMRDRPQPLDLLALNRAGSVLGSVTENGFLSYGNSTDPGGYVSGRLWAFYGTDDWKLNDRLTLDAGMRYQRTWQHGFDLLYTTENVGNPPIMADAAVGGPSGTPALRWEQFSATAWTLGVNYAFTHDVGMFARYTYSFRTPSLSDIYTGATQVPPVTEKIRDAELGLKLRSGGLALFATAFWNRLSPYTDSVSVTNAAGQVLNIPFIGQTRAYGLELEGTWRPVPLFELSGTLTLQKPTFQDLAPLGPAPAVTGVNGNQVERIPEVVGSVTPLLNLDVLQRPTRIYLTVYHQGRRFVDAANSTALPAYTTLDAGLICNLSTPLRLQLIGTNLTNTIGLTEGNPRVDTLSGQGTPTAIYARPIFGRLFRASLTYEW